VEDIMIGRKRTAESIAKRMETHHIGPSAVPLVLVTSRSSDTSSEVYIYSK
jgi:hypothetical protein